MADADILGLYNFLNLRPIFRQKRESYKKVLLTKALKFSKETELTTSHAPLRNSREISSASDIFLATIFNSFLFHYILTKLCT